MSVLILKIVLQIISEAQRNAKQRGRTNVVAEISTTFKVPDDFVKSAMDMGKVVGGFHCIRN